VWRRWLVAGRIAPFLLKPSNRALIKPEALWEHDQAADLTGAQVRPLDAGLRRPAQIDGRAMDTYHRWMEVVIYATFAGLPCTSVPAGFSAAGLPMGLQLTGRPQGEAALLRLARAYEVVADEVLHIRPALTPSA